VVGEGRFPRGVRAVFYPSFAGWVEVLKNVEDLEKGEDSVLLVCGFVSFQ
jgi:hypothetical protein